jgi:hypothetical protein
MNISPRHIYQTDASSIYLAYPAANSEERSPKKPILKAKKKVDRNQCCKLTGAV